MASSGTIGGGNVDNGAARVRVGSGTGMGAGTTLEPKEGIDWGGLFSVGAWVVYFLALLIPTTAVTFDPPDGEKATVKLFLQVLVVTLLMTVAGALAIVAAWQASAGGQAGSNHALVVAAATLAGVTGLFNAIGVGDGVGVVQAWNDTPDGHVFVKAAALVVILLVGSYEVYGATLFVASVITAGLIAAYCIHKVNPGLRGA